jgi:RNA polymerase primary sigma factor
VAKVAPPALAENLTSVRISAQPSNDLGHEPTEDEVSEELGIAAEELARVKRVGLRRESLDAFVGDDDVTEFGENVPDEQAQTPFELLRKKDFSDQVCRFLKTLNQRETTIITERFGLNGTVAKPPEHGVETIGVTRERVRRLEQNALAKLRYAFSMHLNPLDSEVFAGA